jgi:hypothetical protein
LCLHHVLRIKYGHSHFLGRQFNYRPLTAKTLHKLRSSSRRTKIAPGILEAIALGKVNELPDGQHFAECLANNHRVQRPGALEADAFLRIIGLLPVNNEAQLRTFDQEAPFIDDVRSYL